jgi:short subunit dehydrogenase-like uncharacterized protein
MASSLLLYGASGFTGRLIAAEARRLGMSRSGAGAFRMILAGRDGPSVTRVASHNDMDWRVFPLDDPAAMANALNGIDVVLNAAGPFADTAVRLSRAAAQAHCGYVDINSETDVYDALEQLAATVDGRKIVMVSGAGAFGAAADLMVLFALGEIPAAVARAGLGAIRIAHSMDFDISRGGAAALFRTFSQYVLVVGPTTASESGNPCCAPEAVADVVTLSYRPVGALERVFDFGPLPEGGGPHTASGVTRVDTLTVRDTAMKQGIPARRIETYEAIGPLGRAAYQIVSNVPLFFDLPAVRSAARASLDCLPEGPTKQVLDAGRHAIVLEIDDPFGAHLIDWRLETPNAYRLTARLAVAAAIGAAQRKGAGQFGWTTPGEALGLGIAALGTGPLAGCALERRRG